MTAEPLYPKSLRQRTLLGSAGSGQSEMARIDRDLIAATQGELKALLRRVRARPQKFNVRPAPETAPPIVDFHGFPPPTSHSQSSDCVKDARSLQQPLLSNIGASPTVTSIEASPGGKPFAPLVLMGIAWAGFAFMALALDFGALDRIAQVGNRVTTLEQRSLGLDKLIGQRLATQDRRIDGLAEHLDEARYPAEPFKDAQDLMAAGRYMDAESAYGALLASRPTSSLSPTIAWNSAIANAALGRCQMVRVRLAQLRALRPQDRLLVRSESLLTECLHRHRDLLPGTP